MHKRGILSFEIKTDFVSLYKDFLLRFLLAYRLGYLDSFIRTKLILVLLYNLFKRVITLFYSSV